MHKSRKKELILLYTSSLMPSLFTELSCRSLRSLPKSPSPRKINKSDASFTSSPFKNSARAFTKIGKLPSFKKILEKSSSENVSYHCLILMSNFSINSLLMNGNSIVSTLEISIYSTEFLQSGSRETTKRFQFLLQILQNSVITTLTF